MGKRMEKDVLRGNKYFVQTTFMSVSIIMTVQQQGAGSNLRAFSPRIEVLGLELNEDTFTIDHRSR